jgi:protein involved in polysaccharide export with SLBB domain
MIWRRLTAVGCKMILLFFSLGIASGQVGNKESANSGTASALRENDRTGAVPPLIKPSTLPSGTNLVASPTSLSGYVPDDKYKLRIGDKISLQIMEDRDLPKSLIVADSGELDVPYVGRVPASDKTCRQLAEELKAQLEKEYYYRATVILALDVANKFLGRIYVWGQVKNQGPIDIAVNENLTAGKAILRAGGFGDFANKKKVKVVRGGSGSGVSANGASESAGKQNFELNMVDILESGKTEKDMVLQPDDFIIVPSRLINF